MTAKQRLRQRVLELEDRYAALDTRHERLLDAARSVIGDADMVTGCTSPESLAELDEMSTRFNPYAIDFNINKVLTPERVALLKKMDEKERDHPTRNPLKFRDRAKITYPHKLELPRELFYSRWLRVRWEPRPSLFSSISVRAWFGRLEIVLDPIDKDRWVKRDRNYKKVR